MKNEVQIARSWNDRGLPIPDSSRPAHTRIAKPQTDSSVSSLTRPASPNSIASQPAASPITIASQPAASRTRPSRRPAQHRGPCVRTSASTTCSCQCPEPLPPIRFHRRLLLLPVPSPHCNWSQSERHSTDNAEGLIPRVRLNSLLFSSFLV